MSRSSLRRAASVVAATALLAGGLAVGAGTATAAPESDKTSAAAAAQKPHTATKTTDNITVTRSVVGDGTVAPGQKVTLRTTLSVNNALDRYITKINDFHPEGFQYVKGSAKVTAWHLIGGSKAESVTPQVDVNDKRVTVTDAGWLISKTGSKTLTLDVTYLVPKSAEAGDVFDTGVGFDVSGFGTTQKFNPIGAFVTVRNLNPGEAVSTGSADLGFGSSDGEGGTTGSAGSAIIENPSGFIADVISGVISNGS
ncbi:hypothetical protein ACFWPA_02570 [Rhodococcus sp. NPDC058505]|uniref:hypothetical protein n=1 Tax=unclassified Rhodococcus (in: high G+C Gram-positive bacteria) TaxID=192944 RepID=UPI003664BE7E